jgi:hypothetical protein
MGVRLAGAADGKVSSVIQAPGEGVVCLANDGIIDGLIALCASLRAHNPDLPLTVIPFDSSVTRTRRVVKNFGYEIYEGPSLETMDSLGARYWPGETWRPHAMRKFCAFWGPYERFLFLDADIVVLRPLEEYFEAFRACSAPVMYFQTDVSMVYCGRMREQMTASGLTVGFQTGVFMGRRGTFRADELETLVEECGAHRDGFVDILEQTFLNYAVDVAGLAKVNAHQTVPDVVDAWAGMRLRRTRDGFVLDDARTPQSGRPVTLIHWGGYSLGPFMPYRRTFLAYRLAGATRAQRIGHIAGALLTSAGRAARRSPLYLVHRWRKLARNWMASRGYSGLAWHIRGSSAGS